MAKHVILTLDLYTEVSWEQRGALYAALEREGWAQVDRLTTLWRATYPDDRDAPDLLDEARHDVASCTASCGIADFEAALAVSDGVIASIYQPPGERSTSAMKS